MHLIGLKDILTVHFIRQRVFSATKYSICAFVYNLYRVNNEPRTSFFNTVSYLNSIQTPRKRNFALLPSPMTLTQPTSFSFSSSDCQRDITAQLFNSCWGGGGNVRHHHAKPLAHEVTYVRAPLGLSTSVKPRVIIQDTLVIKLFPMPEKVFFEFWVTQLYSYICVHCWSGNADELPVILW
jgi:hypothetical protein